MKVVRVLAALLAGMAGVAPALVGVAGPAAAHGALTNPVSRLAACGPEGKSASSAACVAALAESGTDEFDDWDNLRLPNVRGRDRQMIPDGQLCSAGIDRYRGLDLPRRDWPATELTPGADLTFTYRGTIPHKGAFRLYVSRDGYDPTAPLAWSDLEEEPFLTAKDPALSGGSYRIKGTLPAGKEGRHLIYTIWQNSDTPDTYYSCSDVVFKRDEGPQPTEPTKPAERTEPTKPVQSVDALEQVANEQAPEPVAATSALPLIGGGAAVIVVLGALFAIFLHRRRS